MANNQISGEDHLNDERRKWYVKIWSLNYIQMVMEYLYYINHYIKLTKFVLFIYDCITAQENMLSHDVKGTL